MKILLVALVATSALTVTAYAAEAPVIAPPPVWVKPVAPLSVTEKSGDTPIRIILSDQQIAFEQGRKTVYTETILRIQTPQGLSAGNISLPWRPETDVLVVHKLLIRRGDQTIDVLKSGQTFTVLRREQNLESATLDGILTANIQPEGLQVGDVLELAASVSSSDPVLKGHVEQIAGAWNFLPIGRAHLRMQWPSNLPNRLRSTALPEIKPTKAEGTTSMELSLDNVEPIMVPKGAPERYQLGRLIEVTDFASWGELGALMAPLYEKAAVLPAQGPLSTELERIRNLSSDPKVRTEAALALVQDRVRYVALAMGTGDHVPADAEKTWSRRYGDCKGKTALLIALLHAMGIEAEPVAVSTVFGDGLNERLPMIGLFNHVLVRASIAGRTYWLDGTRSGDTSLDRLTTPYLGWGLPLVAKGAALVRMLPTPPSEPMQDVNIRIDARKGIAGASPAQVETIMRGDAGMALNIAVANLVGEARNRALKEFWKSQYDFIEVKSAAANFDAKSGEMRLTMEGEAKLDWANGNYQTDGTSVGYQADFSRDPGPEADAPFAVAYPYFVRTRETILLPKGHGTFKLGAGTEVDQVAGGIEYKRHAVIVDSVFTIEKTERSLVPEFAGKDAPAHQAILRALSDRAVSVHMPAGYKYTGPDIDAIKAAVPTTASGYIDRGGVYLDKALYDEAMADFDKAQALDPTSAWPLANRGLVHVWKREFPAAVADLDAAAKIDPRNAVVFRARGLMAQQGDNPQEAIAAYTEALAIEPGNAFTLSHRAEAYKTAGRDTEALEDAAAALEGRPDWVSLYVLRANIFKRQDKRDEALAEAAAVVAANPDEAYAYIVAASIYRAFNRQVDAMRLSDQAVALKPDAYAYYNRSLSRPKSDVAGRLADLDAALELDPKDYSAIAEKGKLQAQNGDLRGAISTYTAALDKSPNQPSLLLERGILYARSKDAEKAERDYQEVRKTAKNPVIFNNMCWAMATAGVTLESALADCDTALAKAPDNTGFLDSRGLVLLRLGRIDEAINTYNKVLTQRPRMPSSLFGRALAEARKGDHEKSDADMKAALQIDPGIRDEFEDYGVRF
ncbi:MAG: DUF3857 domain-containing protein [Novosphingobium sp.]|nr:DUF3857 domain-containing protein [Novosphingobium sp.]